jgi:hypothetical protein
MSSKWDSSVGTSNRKPPTSREILDIRTRKLTEIWHFVVSLRHTEAVFEEPMDGQMLIHTLGVVARARGMMKLSKDIGITRAGLFVRSIKEECLSRMLFFGPASLQHAVRQFMAHCHTERNHQGLENRLPQPGSITALPPSPCTTPTAPRGNAQLLPPGRSLTSRFLFSDNSGLYRRNDV